MLNQLRDVGGALSKVTERWVPDAWVILMSLTVVALILAIVGGGASPEEAVLAWGSGVWTLLELAMQFSIAMVAAHACASSPPIYRVLDRLAGLPDPEKPAGAVALTAMFFFSPFASRDYPPAFNQNCHLQSPFVLELFIKSSNLSLISLMRSIDG